MGMPFISVTFPLMVVSAIEKFEMTKQKMMVSCFMIKIDSFVFDDEAKLNLI